MGIQITLERFDVQIVGRAFQFSGQMEPIGRILDYLNDENRSTVPLYDVKLFPLDSRDPGGPLSGLTRAEAIFSEQELGLIYFLDEAYRQKVDLMKNSDRVIAYTPHAVLRGNFHRGAETRLMDLFDMMQGFFLAMTEVNVFPLVDLPLPFPKQTDLLLVNRLHVGFYHAE